MKDERRTQTFSIYGNQDNKAGNPIPYHRTTQGSCWNKASRRYEAWKTYVQKSYSDIYGWEGLKKPIAGMPRGRISALIHFANENHGDSENILKGIADALFMNDKEMDTHTEHLCKQKAGLVIVTIELYEPIHP